MSTTTKNLIESLSLSSGNEVINELDRLNQAFQRLYESDDAHLPKEELLEGAMRLFEVAERIKQAEDLPTKMETYFNEYRPLSKALIAKYKEFLPSDAFNDIEAEERYMDGIRALINAQSYIGVGFEKTSQDEQVRYIYSGMIRISEVVDAYLPYYPKYIIETIKGSAMAFLEDPALKPDEKTQSQSVFYSLAGIKNAAKAILWQIEQFLKSDSLDSGEQATVGKVLDYLKTLQPQWAGDDFKECLREINEARN